VSNFGNRITSWCSREEEGHWGGPLSVITTPQCFAPSLPLLFSPRMPIRLSNFKWFLRFSLRAGGWMASGERATDVHCESA